MKKAIEYKLEAKCLILSIRVQVFKNETVTKREVGLQKKDTFGPIWIKDKQEKKF